MGMGGLSWNMDASSRLTTEKIHHRSMTREHDAQRSCSATQFAAGPRCESRLDLPKGRGKAAQQAVEAVGFPERHSPGRPWWNTTGSGVPTATLPFTDAAA